ncbi:MAG: hypothetical protein GY742_00320 [Hyphomicrobiales bacterium]|nr:hypothetical protein [Hyphomicrobiales bacterium]
MANRIFLIGTVAVVAAAAIAAIIVIGGPFEAREDRFDDLRYKDLVTIARSLACDGNNKVSSPDLPEKLSRKEFAPYCKDSRVKTKTLIDNETGEPYNYHRVNSRSFKVCADFYNAAKIKRESTRSYGGRIAFNTKTGCISGKLR